MNVAVSAERLSPSAMGLNSIADRTLKMAACFWFAVAVVGQWIFLYYVVFVYGGPAMQGNFAAWNESISNAYIPGETLRNIAVAAHLLLAIIVIGGGPLQLIPRIRARLPSFHRWNGRIYLSAALATSIAGLYMTWDRGTLGLFVKLGASLNAVLIIAFGALALRYALARDFKTHRRWALRLFIAASAVWFFRIGLMLWMVVNSGRDGFDPEASLPAALNVMAFAQYLLPLAILEIYLRVRERAGVAGQLTMAAALVVLTLATGAGIVTATMGMWLPHL